MIFNLEKNDNDITNSEVKLNNTENPHDILKPCLYKRR